LGLTVSGLIVVGCAPPEPPRPRGLAGSEPPLATIAAPSPSLPMEVTELASGAGRVFQDWDRGLAGMRIGGQHRAAHPPS
jgi:hypothetical protein